MKTLLENLQACGDAMTWAETLNWEWPRIYAECGCGDWLLWLFTRTNPDDVRLRVLAAARCAETVRHLMTDKRSIDALDAAISFGLGQISEDELEPFVDAAGAAWDAAGAAAWAAGAAAVRAAWAAAAARAAAEADDAAKVENQQKTADIVRSIISIEKFNLDAKIL